MIDEKKASCNGKFTMEMRRMKRDTAWGMKEINKITRFFSTSTSEFLFPFFPFVFFTS